jgi:hypothetical protein
MKMISRMNFLTLFYIIKTFDEFRAIQAKKKVDDEKARQDAKKAEEDAKN